MDKILKATIGAAVLAAIPVAVLLAGYYFVQFDLNAEVDWKFFRFLYAVGLIPCMGLSAAIIDFRENEKPQGIKE